MSLFSRPPLRRSRPWLPGVRGQSTLRLGEGTHLGGEGSLAALLPQGLRGRPADPRAAHQTDSSQSRLGRRLGQVAGGPGAGRPPGGAGVREHAPLPGRRRRDRRSSSPPISRPPGRAAIWEVTSGRSRWQGSPGAAGGGLVSGQRPKPWAPWVAGCPVLPAPHLQKPFSDRRGGPLSELGPALGLPLPPPQAAAPCSSPGLSLGH